MPDRARVPHAGSRELEAAGIERRAAADHDELATKADLDELRTATKGDLAALRVELRIIGAIVLAIAAKRFGISNAVASVLS